MLVPTTHYLIRTVKAVKVLQDWVDFRNSPTTPVKGGCTDGVSLYKIEVYILEEFLFYIY